MPFVMCLTLGRHSKYTIRDDVEKIYWIFSNKISEWDL